ncbi:MAG: putative lipid II flippase FtsW [Gammaproteobacteria bacterium]|nr:putative lipid II flippase FtsW [Gammaproteobacteria bacterium]
MQKEAQTTVFYDKYFLLAVVALVIFGLMMMTSASIAISERQFGEPFYYLIRQGIFLILGTLGAIIILRIPMQFWHDKSHNILMLGIFLLVLVMVPGIGREINGSTRWIGVGPIGIQVSEFIKFAVVAYMSGYLVRHQKEIRTRLIGFIKPMFILGTVAILLLLEPDFGATVVIMITALSMMYLAGMRLSYFVLLLLLVLIAMGVLAISSPYRLVRLTTFLNPWANQFNSGYQLTQSLIAFGRGGFFGMGLGDSIQKLFYLPEAHTDFLFAVLAEELGFVGILIVIMLYTILVVRALSIGRRAQESGQHASGYMAYGFAIWLGIQAIVNMGVSSGLLPTKGLTLPFLSYGGSSFVILCAVIAILIRIDYEARITGKIEIHEQHKEFERRRFGF